MRAAKGREDLVWEECRWVIQNIPCVQLLSVSSVLQKANLGFLPSLTIYLYGRDSTVRQEMASWACHRVSIIQVKILADILYHILSSFTTITPVSP